MEDPLQKLSKQYRTLFYAIQLKLTDTAHILRSNGTKLTQNEIKTFTNQQLSIFSMTEKMFGEEGVPHLYQLLKLMNSNLTSLLVLLIQRVQKLNQKILSTQKPQADQTQAHGSKSAYGSKSLGEKHDKQGSCQMKRNKLGGIQLCSQNYARYLEDHRILDQIKFEKQQRIVKKKKQLLSCMIYNELNHKTDVEGQAASNDDIAKYIVESRSKGSVYNYVPYEEELQEILSFFQDSQTYAKDFLVKRGSADVQDISAKFSFADFQREIQLRNREYQKKVMEKLVRVVQKMKDKQRETEQQHRAERQEYLKLAQVTKLQVLEKDVQTQFQFDSFVKQCQNKMRDIQFKCQALQNHKTEEIKYIQMQNQLSSEISYKALQIQKLQRQIKDSEGVIINLKKMVRQDKAKKHVLAKEDNLQKVELPENRQKSQRKNEKQSVIGQQLATGVEDYVRLNSNSKLRKTTNNKNYVWSRKISNDGTSLIGVNESENEREENSKTQANSRKVAKYNIQSQKPENNSLKAYQEPELHKAKAASFKLDRSVKQRENPFQIQLRQSIQLQIKEDGYIQEKKSSQKIVVNITSQEDKMIPSKSTLLRLQSDPLQNNLTSLSNIEKDQHKNREKSSQSKKNSVNTSKNSKEYQQPIKQLKESIRQSKKHSKQIKEHAKSTKQNIKQAKENTGTPVKRQFQSKQKQDISKKTVLNTKIKQASKVNESSAIKKMSSLKKLEKEVLYKEDKVLKPQIQHLQTKEQHLYKMFEVVQQDAQQEKESMINTQIGSLIDFLQAPIKKFDQESLEKITKALGEIRPGNNYFHQQLYSITIQPFQPLETITDLTNKLRDQSNTIGSHNTFNLLDPLLKAQKTDTLGQLRNSTETSEILVADQNNINNILQVFDKILYANKAIGDSTSLQKLKSWKKKLESSLKNNLISTIDIQNISKVLSVSALNYNNDSLNKFGFNSLEAPQNKSLSDFEQDQYSSCLQPNKFKHFRHNSLNDQLHHKIGKHIQNQLKLQEIISFQTFSHDFSQKFQKYHIHCHQGLICSHVTKYFEIIMKRIEEFRQRQKNLLALHVENIGEGNKDGKKIHKIQQSGFLQPKQIKKAEIQNRYEAKSQQKWKKNKISILPSINQLRSSLCSPRK